MSCILKGEEGKQQTVLAFKREQLLYDIKNVAFAEGHAMPEESEHGRHLVIDIGEEGNVDRVTRVLDLAVAQVRELLYPYTKQDIERPFMNDDFRERKVYGIVLNVPKTFSQTTLTLLGRLIHEYLVCRAVADWMSIANPTKTETWLTKAAQMESELRNALHARMNRTRIKQHWLA